MRDHQRLFDSVRQRPGMYFLEETYSTIAAFVQGYDMACSGGLLVGFREWLVVRLMTGSNLGWPALVLHAAFPDVQSPQETLHRKPDGQRVATDVLFNLLAEYDKVRAKHDGLKDVFVAYENYARRNGSKQ